MSRAPVRANTRGSYDYTKSQTYMSTLSRSQTTTRCREKSSREHSKSLSGEETESLPHHDRSRKTWTAKARTCNTGIRNGKQKRNGSRCPHQSQQCAAPKPNVTAQSAGHRPPANLSARGGALSTLWETLERRRAALTPTEQADSFRLIGV